MMPALAAKTSPSPGQLRWKGIDAGVLAEAGVEHRDGLVRVPYRSRAGEVVNWKCFAGGRSWWERTGVEPLPLGLERLPCAPQSGDVLLVAEGESDALALREHYPTCYVLGLPGACSWRAGWACYLAEFNVVHVLGDGDAPGRAMNWRVRRDVPHVRIVELPDDDDVRGILQRDSRDGLDGYVAHATIDAHLAWALKKATTLAEFEALR